ncbi:MAG: hypothetical protein KDA90_22505 [Planctomycetaceae bacterium]|nr:hypothetical protein [Planctomycetaceae bacterium]
MAQWNAVKHDPSGSSWNGIGACYIKTPGCGRSRREWAEIRRRELTNESNTRKAYAEYGTQLQTLQKVLTLSVD